MKILAIRDDNIKNKDLAYLFYYEKDKQFFIEIPDNADPWDTPLILASFVKKGETTLDDHWSRLWVRQRIVPPDRQNIGMILKDNGLSEYDEFKLLMISRGRCAQDDCCVVPVQTDELEGSVFRRIRKKVEDIVPLLNNKVLVFFQDGHVKKCDLAACFKEHLKFKIVQNDPNIFEKVKIMPGGYGIAWDVDLTILYPKLYDMGQAIPLTLSDFKRYASKRLVVSSEVAEILNCSRQYVDELVKKEKLRPLKSVGKTKLFSKNDVLQQTW